MKKYANITSSEAHKFIVTFTGEVADHENFPFYLDALDRIYDRKEKVGIIFDATKAVFPGLTYQKMQAKWLKDNTDKMINFCVGTADVVPNVVIRNVLKAIFTLQKQPVAFIVCKEAKEADAWLEARLKEA